MSLILKFMNMYEADLCGHNFVQLTPVCIPVYSFVQSRAHCTKSKSNMADLRAHLTKIGTRSVHVGSLCEVSQDTPNYNCTSLRIMTMSNTHDRNFAVYGQTQANCNVFFL